MHDKRRIGKRKNESHMVWCFQRRSHTLARVLPLCRSCAGLNRTLRYAQEVVAGDVSRQCE